MFSPPARWAETAASNYLAASNISRTGFRKYLLSSMTIASDCQATNIPQKRPTLRLDVLAGALSARRYINRRLSCVHPRPIPDGLSADLLPASAIMFFAVPNLPLSLYSRIKERQCLARISVTGKSLKLMYLIQVNQIVFPGTDGIAMERLSCNGIAFCM